MNIISSLISCLKYALFALLSLAVQANPLTLTNTGSEEFLPVEAAYIANVFSDGGQIIVDWQMAPSYYLYEHAFAISADGDTIAFAYSQAGQARHDEYFGDVTVFYDNLQLIANSDATTITVSSQGCADAGLCYPPRRQHFYYDASTNSWHEGLAPSAANPSANQSLGYLLKLIGLAFLGGLILNLMPCVLPVLTIKALSFAKQDQRNARIKQGWAYTAGVLCSFCAIATLLLLLKASGQAVGWGFQLQSPLVIATLIFIFFLMALALLDAFHFKAPSLASAGGNSDSSLNAFSTGVLACVVASPCTAPFMGTAIASALSMSSLPAMLIFIGLGFGMAAPFLILSYAPSTSRLLPKPGQWMNRLKQFLAFPLFGTCVWLLTVANLQSGATAVAVLLSLCIGLAIVVWWQRHMGLVSIIALVAAASAISAALTPQQQTQTTAFSLAALDQQISSEASVFVNVTASWCITCKANEIVLHSDKVQALFAASKTRYIEADWTTPNADISQLLARHQRNGIPLYLLYRNGNIARPEILPQFLNAATLKAALTPE